MPDELSAHASAATTIDTVADESAPTVTSTQSPPQIQNIDHLKASVSTYIEQTKILVSLSSAFVAAPIAIIALLKTDAGIHLQSSSLSSFVASEALFVLSVLFGYLTLASIAGAQHDGKYDVYRGVTRAFSILQITTYLLGMFFFAILVLLNFKQ